jgi:hypothetical protein
MIAYIHFPSDPSVGMFPYGYTCEVPDFTDNDAREYTRDTLKKLYEDLDGEGRCVVIFDDENNNDDPE